MMVAEVTIWRDNAPHVSPFWSGEQIDGYLTRNLMVAPVYSSGKDLQGTKRRHVFCLCHTHGYTAICQT
eukprot:3907346-Amphidinium_carterae.1